MRRLLGGLLAALPFDPRGRRALDETLLDWAAEARGASTLAGRTTACLCGAVAVSRAVCAVTLSEVARVPVLWLVGRVALFGMLPPILLSLVWFLSLPGEAPWRELLSRATTTDAIALHVLLLPNLVMPWLPVAFALAVAWPTHQRRAPIVGAATIACVVALIVSGGVEPMANRGFGELARSIQPPVEAHISWSAPGQQETLAARIADRWRGSDPVTTVWFAVFETGVAPLCAALVMLGGLVARRAPNLMRRWVWLAPAVYFGWSELLRSIRQATTTDALSPYYFWAQQLTPWLLAAALIAAAGAVQRTAPGDTSASPDGMCSA